MERSTRIDTLSYPSGKVARAIEASPSLLMAGKDSVTSLPYFGDEPPTTDELADVRFFKFSQHISLRRPHANTSHEPVPGAFNKATAVLSPRSEVSKYCESKMAYKSIATNGHPNSIKPSRRNNEHLQALSQYARELDQLEAMQRRHDFMSLDAEFDVQPARRPTVKEQHAIEVSGKVGGANLQHSQIKAIFQQEVDMSDLRQENSSSVATEKPDIKRTFSGILGKDYMVSEEEE